MGRERLGVSGERSSRTLLDGEPRVALFAAARRHRRSRPASPSRPTCCSPATRRSSRTGCGRAVATRRSDAGGAAGGAGRGSERALGRADRVRRRPSTHALHLRQRGSDIDGHAPGDFVSRDLTGTIDGDSVRLHSSVRRSTRRRAQLHLHRQGDRRLDVGHARHGRVPDGHVDGDATPRPQRG